MTEDVGPRNRRELGVEAHAAHLAQRRQMFADVHDFGVGRGLEIGPLDSPFAERPASDVRYVDVFDTRGIREHYQDDGNVLLEMIPEIDYPIIVDGRVRTLGEAAGPGAPYDWVVASHVIEHVPDVIGWLQQIAGITTDAGRLLLVVPDRRYCFDRHRPPTTSGQAIEAFERGDTRPGTRALYDFFSAAVQVDPHALWEGAPMPGVEAAMYDRVKAWEMVELGNTGEYVDTHVWTFSPRALRDLLDEWAALGLSEWDVVDLRELPHTVEFRAVLRRRARGLGAAPHVRQTGLPGWLEDERELLEQRIARLESQIEAKDVRIAALRAKARRLRAKVARLQAEPTWRRCVRRARGRLRARIK
ncbi:MAG: methyltransferase domain-containing protein [Nocardioides sp.]|uniref:methyltransferase domain-containing protein n=1 Tax=Nocardioides sp. TaxID=35761 RepID=UPI0039E6C5F6